MKGKYQMNNEIPMCYARIHALQEAWKDFEESYQTTKHDEPERPSGQSDEQDD